MATLACPVRVGDADGLISIEVLAVDPVPSLFDGDSSSAMIVAGRSPAMTGKTPAQLNT
jgi:hypothetical protein